MKRNSMEGIEIKIQTDNFKKCRSDVSLGGWFHGKQTYLWIGTHDEKICLGVMSGKKLYHLAKEIVNQFERGRS